jgi:hypothetical protein
METAAGAIPVTGGDGPARVAVRPERISLGDDGPLRMTVLDATFLGASVRVRLGVGAVRLEAHVRPGTAPPAGERVGVSIEAGAVWRFPDEVVPSMDRDAARP